MNYRMPPPEACEDCRYYANHRCKMWEVKVQDPANSHCDSGQVRE